jgi:flagellar motor switch protein FliG
MKFGRFAAVGLVAVLCSGVCLFAQKEAKGGIESKIALESSMENRLRQVLTEITGTEKIIVIVNVQLAAEKTETTESKKKDDDFILPGVPIKDAINEKQVGDAVMAALGEDTRTLIGKLTVTIIFDKAVPASVVTIAKDVAGGLLGIDPARGDQLIVKQMPFQKNPFYWGMLMVPPNIYWVIMILASCAFALSLILFLFGPFRGFTTEFVRSMIAAGAALKESGRSGGDEAVFGGEAGAAALAAPEISSAKMETQFGQEMPFSFINENNVNALLYLIRNDVSANIASIVNYLPPVLGSKVLAGLPVEKQKEIGSLLTIVKELDPSEIDSLEAKLKKRIGYLSGGAEKLVSLLDYADERTKGAILGSVKSVSSQVSEQVQKALISLDVLAYIDAASLSIVIKAVTPVVFGQVIKALNADLRDKMLGVLPAGAAARIRQEMEMGKAFNPARLEIEKKRIVDVIRKLEARGMINRD